MDFRKQYKRAVKSLVLHLKFVTAIYRASRARTSLSLHILACVLFWDISNLANDDFDGMSRFIYNSYVISIVQKKPLKMLAFM